MNVRATAATVVARVVVGGSSLDSALALGEPQVDPRDLPLLRELCYGTLRWYPRLSVVVNHLLSKPFKSRDGDIHALIACALYQLTETRIPSHAAINEAVSACRALNKMWAKGLVNAVLRRFQREQETFSDLFKDSEPYQSAHPEWLLSAFRESWPDQLPALIAANNGRGPLTLRVNLQRCQRDHYLAQLADVDIAASATSLSRVGIQLATPTPVTALPGFNEGLFSVQDEAAQLCAELLDPQPGHRVLDACSAPGGKACHLLEYQPGIRELLALDSDAERLLKVEESLARLGLSARTQCGDAAKLDDWWDGIPFERILLDAPCSARGVIRRHPDIKLLRKPADIAKLAAVQAELLEQLWLSLAPGGRLLYATCSVLSVENDQVVEKFVASHSDVRVLPVEFDALCAAESALTAGGPGRQLLPTLNSHDGFYYALLEKHS